MLLTGQTATGLRKAIKNMNDSFLHEDTNNEIVIVRYVDGNEELFQSKNISVCSRKGTNVQIYRGKTNTQVGKCKKLGFFVLPGT